MHRHHHKLEVLLVDLECRYGTDHPVSLDIRAALPKVSEAPSGTSKTILSGQKTDTASRFKKDTTVPV